MDVIRKKRKTPVIKKSIVFVLAAMVLLAWYLLASEYRESIERKELIINTVEQGSLQIQVEGYGKLRSSKQKLLTSLSNSTVEEIVLKPGAMVRSDSIIMLLKNPELEHEMGVAKRAYTHELATLRKLKLTQVRELLSNEEKLELIKSDYETAKMRKLAMQDLVTEGIVSKLDFRSVELTTKQLKKRIAIIDKNVEKLKQVHVESINIQLETITDAKSNFESVQQRFLQLTVKAGMEGILQKLPVELGQSLVAGQEIALIGGTEDLVALINVPQAEAIKVRVGQKAFIGAAKDNIESEVIRVSPTVESGSVEIEIALSGTLPVQLRPEQNVDAVIHIERIDEAYFIQRPANVSEYSTSTLYKLAPDQLSASSTAIEFGVTSGQYIEITAGAIAGDSLVLSDLSYLNNVSVIGLAN